MAERSGRGGSAALILGGAAAVAVVLGGYAVVRVSGFGGPDAQRAELESGPDGAGAVREGTAPAGRESNQPLTDILLREAEWAARTAAAKAARDAGSGQTATGGVPSADGTAAPGEAAGTSQDAAPEPQTAALAPQAPLADPRTGDAGALPGGPDGGVPAAEASETAPAEAEPRAFVLQPPELGLVRLDREGGLVIAGRAQAGVRVSVLLDGQVLEQLEVPRDGQFVSLASVAPADRARVISLLAHHDGQQSPSEASFILAPVTEALPGTAAGTAVADAAPDPAGTADGDAPAAAPERAAASESPADLPAGEAPAAVATASSGAAASRETAALQPAQSAASDPAVTPAETDAGPAAEAPPAPDAETPAAPDDGGTAVAVLRAGADGIEVVQPAPLPDPALSGEVALDAISYSEAGSVELAGRARPQSLVRIYVDNAPVAETAAEGSGRWNGSLSGVAPGIYTLRVDEVEAASGDVLSRIETPFKREAPEDLLPPAGEDAPDGHTPLVQAVTVQKGDTLWAISQEKFGNGFLYVRLFEANREAIRNPDLIYPGQVFAIPD